MEYVDLRERVRRIALRTAETGLVHGTSGNVSARTPDGLGVLITPSGVDYYKLRAEQVVLVDLEGQPLEDGFTPSSEAPMHTAIYRLRPDVEGIVHTHSTYATVLASLGLDIPPMHYVITVLGGRIPLAPYATYGTEELAGYAVDALGDKYKATLLANHGMIAVASTVEKAYDYAEMVENLAQLYYLARAAGDPVILTDAQMRDVAEQFQSYGQKSSPEAS